MVIMKLKILKDLISKINSNFEGCYVVGGILRDLFLFNEFKDDIVDIDIIIKKLDFKKLKKIITDFKLPFIILDKENKIYRTVIKNEKSQINIDFSSYTDLEEDIKRRDFTINCLILELKYFIKFLQKNDKKIVFKNIIDKLNSIDDIKQKILRPITKQIFVDDPLRILRAARFACYGFKIEKSIDKLVVKHKDLLKNVSAERITEELKKIFNSESYEIFEWLDKNKVIDVLFPEIAEVKKKGKNTQFRKFYFHKEGLWQHIKLTYNSLEYIIKNLKKFYPKHIKDIKKAIENKIYLLKYVCIFHDIAKPYVVLKHKGRVRFFHHEVKSAEIAHNILQRMKFSNEDTKVITEVIRNHMRLGSLHANKEFLTERAYLRLFRDTEKFLYYLLIFCLADRMSYEVIPIKERKKYFKNFYDIKDFLKFENLILQKHDEYLKKSDLPKLVNGYEVMEILKIKEGPLVGKILNFIRELQLLGKVNTKKEAIEAAKEYIKTLNI